MSSIALHIIARDEVEQLKRIIADYSAYFDEVAIAYDDDIVKKQIQEDEKVKLYKYQWKDDFADKRNFLCSHIKSDYYLRLDTDDTIVNVESIREALVGYVKDGFSEVMMMYYYGFDKNGQCNSRHWRETIIKNDGNLYWNKAIHENIMPKVPRIRKTGKETQIWLVHKTTKEGHLKSVERNLKMLLKEYEETKQKPDPRTVGYIARMYLGMGKHLEAIPFFEKFLETSGWEEDKYFGWVQLCDCYTLLGGFEQALTCANEAMLLMPHLPDAYFKLMSVYFEKKEFNKAIEWGKLGFTKRTPEHMLNYDDTAYTWRPTAQLGLCYLHCGKFAEGIKLLKKAHELCPKDIEIVRALKYFGEVYTDDEMVKHYLSLMKYLNGDLRKFGSLVESFPRKIAHDERLLVMKNLIIPGKVWDEKSVVFFCGGAWEDWVDVSVVGGIGGSEEATIYLAREFTKLGYKVTIFNQCGELAGEYRGVTYKNYYDFNPKDKFNILISWRQNIFAEKNIKAKKRIIWLHDVPSKNQFLPHEADTYDKVLVLSQYHKSLLEGVPDDKILVTSNGLNISDFENITEERNPHRLIYASSYDRGLQQLLRLFPQVKAEVPDAELHIYYGWNTYDAMVKQGRRSQEWKDSMVEIMNQPGVFEHGRIGHKKLIKEYLKSGVWAYPTTFEEISCIGAMRAQACGAVPVVNNYAALRETVKWGIKNEGDVRKKETFDNYAKELIALLKDPSRQEALRSVMMTGSKDFSWERVALEWQKELF